MSLRFLVDESTGHLVARYLLEAGHDAIAVATVLPQASDKAILAYAVQEDRIVITNDKDFGDLIFLAHLEHRGVILLRSEDHRPTARWRMLDDAILRYGARLGGAFTVITNEGIRIRY
jgi:predicted nuclease of predicted toxin-antitoxin system